MEVEIGCFVVIESAKLREICINLSAKQPSSIGPCRPLKAEGFWSLHVGR